MGSWHATCNISQLPITPGEKVRVLFLSRCPYSMDASNDLALGEGGNGKEGCSSTDFWHPRMIPLKSTYDDYGRPGKLDETSLSYELFWDQLKADLVQTPQGENEYHDPASSSEMDWDQMWWVAQEGRLRVNGNYGHKSYPDGHIGPDGKMLEGVPAKPRALPVCAVMIREDVYQAMLNMPALHQAYEPENGDWNNPSSNHVYRNVNVEFYKSKLQASMEKLLNLPAEDYPMPFSYHMYQEKWNAGLDALSPPYSLGVKYFFEELIKKILAGTLSKDDPRVDQLLTEIAEINFIMSMYSSLRKTWHPGTGCGSQNNNLDQSYLFHSRMAAVALDAHKAERREYGDRFSKNSLTPYLPKRKKAKKKTKK